MRKLLILIYLISFGFTTTGNLRAEQYAILITGGKTTMDREPGNSLYWCDLFLAYENLIFKEGFTHDNIYVCYGDGVSWNSSLDRYNLNYHNWPEIVDLPNDRSSILNCLYDLADKTDYDDHIVIRWVAGHGGNGGDPDDYDAEISNHSEIIEEFLITHAIHSIRRFSQKLVFWMTCYSGSLVAGDLRVDGPYTLVSTSSRWDETSVNDTLHAMYNYWLTGFANGEVPDLQYRTGETIILDADDDNNGYVTMDELYSNMYDSAEYPAIHPPIAGCDGYRNFITMGGVTSDAFPKLQNIQVGNSRVYNNVYTITAAGDGTYFRVLQSGNVTLEARDKVSLLPGFTTQEGCNLSVYTIRAQEESSTLSSTAVLDKKDAKQKTEKNISSDDSKETKDETPTVFSCSQNFPNPFNRSTTIKYGLPHASDVSFTIYNLLGQSILNINTREPAGYKTFTWDRKDNNGNIVASGVYFFVLQAGEENIAIRKMTALK